MYKPILCLDFDGVIHSYTSGWRGAAVIPDPPVPGAMAFINTASDNFDIHIFSSRSSQSGGIESMKLWLEYAMKYYLESNKTRCGKVLSEIKWPKEKPPAMVTIDDRALTFTGTWPDMKSLREFKPWNK